MGYETKYTLEVKHDDYSADHKEELAKLNGFNVFDGDSHSWYDHEDFMRDYSELHPDIVFLLKGSGENEEDLWHKYFKNGKMQECRAEITYPLYDETKLISA